MQCKHADIHVHVSKCTCTCINGKVQCRCTKEMQRKTIVLLRKTLVKIPFLINQRLGPYLLSIDGLIEFFLSDLDVEECDQRRTHCLDEMADLEKQFSDIKEQYVNF